MQEGQPYGPETWDWMYYNNDYLSSNIQSGAFRLENGNTFITEFDDSKMIEVTYEGDIVFEHSTGMNNRINRSKKYPSNYLEPSILGDINYDEIIDISDIIILINIIVNEDDFLNGADINYDDTIDILDVICLINIILAN